MKVFFKLFFSSAFLFVLVQGYSFGQTLCSKCRDDIHDIHSDISIVGLNTKVNGVIKDLRNTNKSLGLKYSDCGELEFSEPRKTVFGLLENVLNENQLIKEGILNINSEINKTNEKIDKTNLTMMEAFGDVSDEKINMKDTLLNIEAKILETKEDVLEKFTEIKDTRLSQVEGLIKSNTHYLKENSKKMDICAGLICEIRGCSTINVESEKMKKVFEEMNLAVSNINNRENTILMSKIIDSLNEIEKNINDNLYSHPNELLFSIKLVKENCENVEYNDVNHYEDIITEKVSSLEATISSLETKINELIKKH